MELQEALRRFLVQLEADGRSPLTADQYRRHIGALDRWLAATGRSRAVEDIAHETLAAFLVSDAARRRPDRQLKRTSTANAMRTSVRSFWAFAHAAGYVPTNPARLVRRALCAPPPPRTLSDSEARRLVAAAAAGTGDAARRDAALIRLLLGTGLRLSSALGLRVEDVDFERGEIRVARAKGDRPIVLPISGRVCRDLRRFLRGRAAGWIFPGEAGEPLTRRQAGRRVGQWANAAGLGGKASAHVLRHAFAQRVLARTGSLQVVQVALGHRSLNSTAVYARLSDGALRAALR